MLPSPGSTLRAGATTKLDEHGEARLGPLFPCQLRLTLQPFGGYWRYVHPEPIALPAATELPVAITLTLASGRVRFVDLATSAPLAKVPLRIGMAVFTTDDDGWLEFEMPVGSFPVSTTSLRGELHWGANGPLDEVCELSPD